MDYTLLNNNETFNKLLVQSMASGGELRVGGKRDFRGFR